MFKHTSRSEAQASPATWYSASAHHIQMAETTVTVAVIAYFATFLLTHLLFV